MCYIIQNNITHMKTKVNIFLLKNNKKIIKNNKFVLNVNVHYYQNSLVLKEFTTNATRNR